MMRDDEDRDDLEHDDEALDSLDNEPGGRGFGFATGLVIGALIGAGVALLLAPARGTVTRRRLKRRMRHAGERARDELDGFGGQMRRELRRRRRELRRGAERVRS